MNVGEIYVIATNLTRPPKDKIVLCICAERNLFFWINTKAALHGQGQFALAAEDHPALSHPCYLDCSRVTTFSDGELAAARPRGPITAGLGEAIKAFLIETPPKTLTKVFFDLACENL